MRRTLRELGRDQLKEAKVENKSAAAEFRIGEAIQFYKDGWRYGHVAALGQRGQKAGMIQIEHPITGMHWVAGADIRHLSA